MIVKTIKNILKVLVAAFALFAIFIYIILLRLKPQHTNLPRLFWGPVPIKNWNYAATALAELGYYSKTVMKNYYGSINESSDFDLYVNQIFQSKFYFKFLSKRLQGFIAPFAAFCFCLKEFDIFHIPFSGGLLSDTPLEKIEPILLQLAKKKTVVLPYGSDLFKYSFVSDLSVRHVLLDCYSSMSKQEQLINRRMNNWIRHADVIFGNVLTDGIGRWDLLPVSYITIDNEKWQPKKYSEKEKITILHTPNHRSIKGTEFILQAIKSLQDEGYSIEIILLEKVQNEVVRQAMQEADILIDQLILTGYALSAIEGMATGLPVIANLDNPNLTTVFRRYSYLNECPILSATPETLKDNLRVLIKNSALRKELGQAGRKFVEKYHSKTAAQYMFRAVYDKIWFHKEIDLMNLFHPLKSEYVQKNIIAHPLFENSLPNQNVKKQKLMAEVESCATA